MKACLAALACLALVPPALGAEPSGGWLRDQMKAAQDECHESQDKIAESRSLIQEALRLTAKAPPEDLEGRGVARQAEFKARSALAKNKLWHERACARAKNLEGSLNAIAAEDNWLLPIYVKGDVKVDTGSGFKLWDGKSELLPGQTIKTGKDGYAEMFLHDGSAMRIGPNTEFRVEKEEPIFEKGSFYYSRLKQDLEHPEAARYRYGGCDHCAVGVRGTKFALVINPAGDSSLALIEGKAALMDTRAGSETLLHAGQQIFFRGAKIIRGPEPLDPKSFQKMVRP